MGQGSENSRSPERPTFYMTSVSELLDDTVLNTYGDALVEYWRNKLGPEADGLRAKAATIAQELGEQHLRLFGLGIRSGLGEPDLQTAQGLAQCEKKWKEMEKQGLVTVLHVEEGDEFDVNAYERAVVEAECQDLLSIQRVRDALPGVTGDTRFFLMEMVKDNVQQSLGCEAVALLKVAEKRIWLLITLSRKVPIGSRGRDFLHRVGRSYVWGFEGECIVLCRSVLDVEFECEISTDDCESILGPRGKGQRFDLCDRIGVALKLGRIDDGGSGDAHKVRMAANKWVHEGGKPELRSEDAIRKVLNVLSDLARQHGAVS